MPTFRLFLSESYFLHGYHTNLLCGLVARFMVTGIISNRDFVFGDISNFSVGTRKRKAEEPVAVAGVGFPVTFSTRID
jgi:hypothetical protein